MIKILETFPAAQVADSIAFGHQQTTGILKDIEGYFHNRKGITTHVTNGIMVVTSTTPLRTMTCIFHPLAGNIHSQIDWKDNGETTFKTFEFDTRTLMRILAGLDELHTK